MFCYVQINLAGGLVVCTTEAIHDLVQWYAGFSQEGRVRMSEYMRGYVNRNLCNRLQTVYTALYALLRYADRYLLKNNSKQRLLR